MTNAVYATIAEYNDVQTVNVYREQLATGADLVATFAAVQATSRDRSRSPYQWNAAPHAGFTTGRPWIGVNPNYTTINRTAESADPDSVFHYYRRLIALRKATPALIYGEFIPQNAPDQLYVYRRVYAGRGYQVVLNLSDITVAYPCAGRRMIGNYAMPEKNRLQPYEAGVYALD